MASSEDDEEFRRTKRENTAYHGLVGDSMDERIENDCKRLCRHCRSISQQRENYVSAKCAPENCLLPQPTKENMVNTIPFNPRERVIFAGKEVVTQWFV